MNHHILNAGATWLLICAILMVLFQICTKGKLQDVSIWILLFAGLASAGFALADPRKTPQTIILTSVILVIMFADKIIITNKLDKQVKWGMICVFVFGVVLFTISMMNTA